MAEERKFESTTVYKILLKGLLAYKKELFQFTADEIGCLEKNSKCQGDKETGIYFYECWRKLFRLQSTYI